MKTVKLARAADPPAKAPAMDMPGIAMSGPMNMGLAPMPAVYAGQADKPGAPVFSNLGDHHHAISTRNPQTQMLFDQDGRCQVDPI